MTSNLHNVFIILLLLNQYVAANEQEKVIKDDDYWFDIDWEEKASKISEGELRFLLPDNELNFHRIENFVTISDKSLDTGWINISQCHYQLDPVPVTEIVYQYKQMSELNVVRSRYIDEVRVKNHSVELFNVKHGAELCLNYSVKHLTKIPQGWTLILGPYYRGFFDGYYPVHVKIVVEFPQDYMKLKDIDPVDENGMTVKKKPGSVAIDAWFEGKLILILNFEKQ